MFMFVLGVLLMSFVCISLLGLWFVDCCVVFRCV